MFQDMKSSQDLKGRVREIVVTLVVSDFTPLVLAQRVCGHLHT